MHYSPRSKNQRHPQITPYSETKAAGNPCVDPNLEWIYGKYQLVGILSDRKPAALMSSSSWISSAPAHEAAISTGQRDSYRFAISPRYVISSNGALDSVVPSRKSANPVIASTII